MQRGTAVGKRTSQAKHVESEEAMGLGAFLQYVTPRPCVCVCVCVSVCVLLLKFVIPRCVCVCARARARGVYSTMRK